MAAKAPPPSPPRSGCFSCGCGCGCGIVLFLLPFLFVAGIVAWHLGPIWADLRAKPSLPETIPVTREDRDRLETKLAAWTVASASGVATLELTLPEANALLSRFNPPPFKGLVIEKVQLVSGAPKPKLLISGSGFWFPDLLIQIQASPNLLRLDPVQFQINKASAFDAPLSALIRAFFQDYWETVPVSRGQPLKGFLTDLQISESALTVSGRSPLTNAERED